MKLICFKNLLLSSTTVKKREKLFKAKTNKKKY